MMADKAKFMDAMKGIDELQKHLEAKAFKAVELVQALGEALGDSPSEDEIEEMASETMNASDEAVERNHAHLREHGCLDHALLQELSDSFTSNQAMHTQKVRNAVLKCVRGTQVEREPCPGCLGKGRYVGATTVEDPCGQCGGSGRVGN